MAVDLFSELDELLETWRKGNEAREEALRLVLELRGAGMKREVLARRMVDKLGMSLFAARKAIDDARIRAGAGVDETD